MKLKHFNKHYKIFNNIDISKKKNFKNRLIISIFFIFFYALLFLFSSFSNSDWTSFSSLYFSKKQINSIFAFLFLIILIIPLFFVIKEASNLVFSQNHKIIFCLILLTFFSYLIPSLAKIFEIYYPDFLSNFVFLQKGFFYLLIFLFIFPLLFFLNIFLFFTKNNNLKNISILNTIFFLIPISFLGFFTIGLTKNWTTIFFLIISIASTDVMCYLSGLLFGKTKMAKNISPNKTWEGAILGSISTILLLFLFSFLLTFDEANVNFINNKNENRGLISLLNILQTQIDFWNVSNIYIWLLIFLISLVLTVSAIFGDLFFSYIKRKYEIKDFGNLLKSHGGFLDRFDSFIFTIFIYFLYFVGNDLFYNLSFKS